MSVPAKMRAVSIHEFGGPEKLEFIDWPTPQIGESEVLIRVRATALNRADLLQRMGKYPPPPGASPIPGLEVAGEIVAIGKKVINWDIGARVCTLLAGGGYAQYINIHGDMAMSIPAEMNYEEAAAIPEVFLTAFQAIHWLADLQAGEKILIHAGASGVGTAAIQLAKMIGAKVIVTASAAKHTLCDYLGADLMIDYKKDNFEAVIAAFTEKQGVDVIIDFIGAPYFQANLNSLAMEGRLVQLAFMGGVNPSDVNIAPLLRNRLKLMGSTLRARNLEYKIRLIQDFQKHYWHHFSTGNLKAIIDSVYNWESVAEAHRYMESNQNQGKIVLMVD
ncbi:MAG: NAD(P)H quinone oxidoreductase [Saprospiraceae bacterium]|nr:MAG: NAD(P)H quinone oxidoreductase [Saprospiraceae bacterium]